MRIPVRDQRHFGGIDRFDHLAIKNDPPHVNWTKSTKGAAILRAMKSKRHSLSPLLVFGGYRERGPYERAQRASFIVNKEVFSSTQVLFS
jgi:hypothetical protein